MTTRNTRPDTDGNESGNRYGDEVLPPEPYGPLPSDRQLAWHELEFYGFVHFTVNTFTDLEWGYGDESPAVFNPTGFDAAQIADTARAAGMAGLVLTCKHHDGFCLWPSRYTEHSVKNSRFRSGKGDVVSELSHACADAGIRFGVYLSPWDRNHPAYATQDYIIYYRNQLRELLTEYGDLFEVWFDGANGGDGYYGGARETRSIDPRTYYGWEETWNLVRELQPGACMFSDVGPDIRWVGNEKGVAGDPCWPTLDLGESAPGDADREALNRGDPAGAVWLPAECDVSIRPGWFYHRAEDQEVRTSGNLMELYYASVGRGAALHLNLPPDTRGLIHEHDRASLLKFARHRRSVFERDLTRGATVTASSVRGQTNASGSSDAAGEPTDRTRGGSGTYSADRVIDGDAGTYWSTDDGIPEAAVTVELPQPVRCNVVELREYLPLGRRIDSFRVDVDTGDGWRAFGFGESVGHRRLLRGEACTPRRIRVSVTCPRKPAVPPAVSKVGVYYDPGTAES